MLAWQSLDIWFVTLISIAYLAVLFIVAFFGQHRSNSRPKTWVYSLSLGVCCSSWAFYGTVGQAALSRDWLAPLYIGTIACFLLGWPMLLKTLRIIKQQNLTSIADFISCRYDRSPQIAALVAIVTLIGLVPYIALQLRAISTSFDLLTGTLQVGASTALIVTLVLIAFSIVFGAQHVSASKQNPGLVLAIAFSSVVKLFAFTLVGLFACFYLFDGVGDLLAKQAQIALPSEPSPWYAIIAQTVLGAITIFILPQQFHMTMIENNHEGELKTARWLFPLYLIAINLFVLPIALAGLLSFPGGSVNPDTFVLSLPLFHQQAWLGVIAYIGGLAAATSMVVVAAIVLSTMLSNDILTPTMLKLRLFNEQNRGQISGVLLTMRRTSIVVILALAFAFERLVIQHSHLASVGLLSFVLLSQFAPAVIGALYWQRATSRAAFSSVCVGSLVWLYTLLLPMLAPQAGWVIHGPWSIAWLQPTALFYLSSLDPLTHGVVFSLVANALCFIVVSLFSKQTVGETLQANLYVNKQKKIGERKLSSKDLYSLLQRFIDKDAADRLLQFAQQQNINTREPSNRLMEYTRLQLSGVLGSASTRMVMKAAANAQHYPLEDVVSIVDEATQVFQFNRELLQSGVENIEQGISVIDSDMRLVAWNKRYVELLDYPDGFVVAGMHVSDLLRYNIDRGVIEGDDESMLIEKRIEHMRHGHNHHYQRIMPDGRVLEIRGQAMPGGGFVSTFSDITVHVQAERLLQQANEVLEQQVAKRTYELEHAKAQAEAANQSKTRFLAAASHDLMQPFNALSLFTSMLKKKADNKELQQLANHIDDSLNVVEALLSDLVEISRLDGGSHKVEVSKFCLSDVLTPLANEFTVLAQQRGVQFHCIDSDVWVQTDKRLLRRIIQNFLSNALHYGSEGHDATHSRPKIVLGVRRTNGAIRIQVWDNGPGIASDKQAQIFKEFERLEQRREIPGLGLGLAICERIATLLGLTISVQSTLNKGSGFMLDVKRVEVPVNSVQGESNRAMTVAPTAELVSHEPSNAVQILLLDNDPLMLTALSSQLREWGCRVVAADDQASLNQCALQCDGQPDLIIADYHLGGNTNGVDVISELVSAQDWQTPCIIVSADPSEQVRQHTSNANYQFLPKPVKALALKRVLKQVAV
ncbi:PAS domain-containing hybrid sensor histidine kinase/response regulator [Thalassotalea ponticola]|uniref:hybrid sensor histidine kinase/response regulator n=1 Tax=Thalassotalea ponticola TaxID=1523392 RepID=UPI0025B3D4C8|nr:PAS domain-containing hybrid sensor histidine kinase/response regulator [Thalassotalea ponticola]MDN3653140.1 PAS domain-containing hybrid sensor histidine kinase/response regulator [Thalassotalea ponticola]